MTSTSTRSRQYSDEQYNRTPDHELGLGFSNYERLMVELNNRQYYSKEVYENFLNENGLDAYETFDKNTDHAKLLETVYSILQTLLRNIEAFGSRSPDAALQHAPAVPGGRLPLPLPRKQPSSNPQAHPR